MASYADARAASGRWLLRIEDLDPPRESLVAAASFPHTLEHYGFEWDGPILYQSTRGDAYVDALQALIDAGHAFPCACTRSDLSSAPVGAGGERIYPGTCRYGVPPHLARRSARAWRVRVGGEAVGFDDRIQGRYEQDLGRDVGDFVVRRGDGLWAYQLAVVVDDRDQGITDVVRGADLLASAPRQILLRQRLGGTAAAASPRHAHVPIAVNARGEKLSKQTLAEPLPGASPVPPLMAAWRFLDQIRPVGVPADAREFWSWAIPRWDMTRVERGPKPAPSAEVIDVR